MELILYYMFTIDSPLKIKICCSFIRFPEIVICAISSLDVVYKQNFVVVRSETFLLSFSNVWSSNDGTVSLFKLVLLIGSRFPCLRSENVTALKYINLHLIPFNYC